MSRKKQRLDRLLVEKGLVESRSRGQALIMAGSVLVNGRSETKSGTMVPIEARIELASPPPYVGRGGYKLAAAMDAADVGLLGNMLEKWYEKCCCHMNPSGPCMSRNELKHGLAFLNMNRSDAFSEEEIDQIISTLHPGYLSAYRKNHLGSDRHHQSPES